MIILTEIDFFPVNLYDYEYFLNRNATLYTRRLVLTNGYYNHFNFTY